MESNTVGDFFNEWEPPPVFSIAPQDLALTQRISKLAEFAHRNGPHFVELLKKKQKDNLEYSFLFGGEGSEYYRWVLYCSVCGHPPDRPPPSSGHGYHDSSSQLRHQGHFPQHQDASLGQSTGQQPPSQTGFDGQGNFGMRAQGDNLGHDNGGFSGPLAQGLNLPVEVGVGFEQVLEGLNGSKDSIKASQNWFMACGQFADGLAMMMARRVQRLDDYNKQLHIIYLANDILFKSLSQRQPGQNDVVARAFKPVLGSMMATAYMQGGQTSEVKQRLMKILSFWADRGVFNPTEMTNFEQAMFSGNTTLEPHVAANFSSIPIACPSVDPVTSMGSQSANPLHLQGMHPQHSRQQADCDMQPVGIQDQHAHAHQEAVKLEQPETGHIPPWQAASHQSVTVDPVPSQQVPWQQATMPSVGDTCYNGFQSQPHASLNSWAPNQGSGPQAPWPGMTNPPMMGFPTHPGADFMPPPPLRPPFDPPPEISSDGQPVNPMAFPPGLIPKLVRDKGRQLMPYSPLGPLEIDRAGLPPPPNGTDPYLRSRLEKFYADIEEYRPGLVRMEIEERKDGKERPSRFAREGEEERKARRRKRSGFDMVADPATGMMPDGSYAGPEGASSSMHAGLGTNTRHETMEDDVYQSYRKMRSDVYHQSITRIVPPPARPER